MATYSSSLYKTGYYLKLEVNEQSYSVANNSSTLSWRLYIQTTNGYHFSRIRIGAKVVIDGATVFNQAYSSSSQHSCSVNSTETIASGTTVVSHNANGTKTIAAGQISASNSTGGNVVPNMSLSSGHDLVLTNIPRASTITTTAGSTLMGTVRTINITRAADTFTHTLTYTFGSASGTIIRKTPSTAVSWTVPTSLASALTNAKSGTGTITCETFNGNDSVGTSTATFTATIPPSTATPANSTTTMGVNLPFTIARVANNLTHTVEWKFGNQTSYTALDSSSYGTSFVFSTTKGNTAALAAYVPTNNSSGSGTMRITTKNGSATVGTSTCAFKLAIPASSFSVSTDPITMGNAQTFSITRAASNITHKLTYSIGSASGTIGTGIGTSKTWTVPASLAAQVTALSGRGTITVTMTTYNGTAVCGSVVTGTFSAYIPVSTYTQSSNSVYVWSSVTFNISRAATTLYHTVQYSETSNFSSPHDIANHTSATKVTWTPEPDILDSIPGTSKKFYLRVITYNGASASTSVGNVTSEITVKVPNNASTRPQIASVSLTPSSSLSSPFSGLFIQNYSKVRASVVAQGMYNATISRYAITVSGVTNTSNSSPVTSSNTLSVSGTVSVKVTVTDSRGFTAYTTKSITVYAYSTPTVIPYTGNTSIIAARATSSGTVSKSGTYLHIECGRKISTLGGNNQGKIEYVLLNRDNQQIATGTLSANNAAASRDATPFTSSSAVVEDLTKTYTVQIVATDTFGNSTTYTVNIPTDEVTMDLRRYGMGIGIGQYSTSYKTLEIAPDWGIQGRVYGLGWLPQIPADSDLNNYRTPGRYAVFNSVLSSLTNLPSGATQGGVLTVISALGNAYYDIDADVASGSYIPIIQEYRTMDGSYEWERVVVGINGGWSYGGWRRIYPQANASSVSLTYVSNSGITSANFSSGFTLYQSGVNCILYVNAAPAAAAVTSFTTIGTIPEGARPNAAVVQNTNAQNSTTFVEVAIRLSTDGNIQLYSPGTQTSRIQMVIPYFTNL